MTDKHILPTPWETLPRLPIGQQAILFTVLAEGYARPVAADWQRFWPLAENAVFNGRTVHYCGSQLRRRKLAQLISSGCDLEYIAELAPGRTQEAAVAVAEDAASIRRWLIKSGAASRDQRPVPKTKLTLLTPWDDLQRRPNGQQAIFFTILAESCARLVAEADRRHWQFAECAVFNDWTYVYCKDVLRCRRLADLISRGIQLEDVLEWAPAKLRQSALENAEQAVALRHWLIEKVAAGTEKRRRL